METSSINREILGLENKYWEAMKNKDTETAVSLTKFPCVVTSPQGVQSISEDQYRTMLQASKPELLKDIKVQDPHVVVLNPDTAMISYTIQMNDVRMLDISTWVRESGKWVCAFHSEHPIN